MAGERLVLTLMIFVAVAGSISDISQTAYGEDVWSPSQSGSQGNTGLIDEVGGVVGTIVGGSIDAITDFFSAIIPSFTGIWIIDNMLINPLLTFAGYKAAVFLRGGGG